MHPIQSIAILSKDPVRVPISDLSIAVRGPPRQRKEDQDFSSYVDVKNFSVNSLLTKSGRARPSFKAILRLSSLLALCLSLLVIMLGEGGVLLLLLTGLERVDVKDVVAEENVGARLKGRRVREVGFDVAARCSFEVVDRQTVFTLLVEGDKTFIVFLGSGVLRNGFNHSFVGVIGMNQSVYS